MDAGLVDWLRSWGGDRPLSQKVDACIALTRTEAEAQALALATPAGDSLLALRKLQHGEDLAPDEVRSLLGAMLERERKREAVR